MPLRACASFMTTARAARKNLTREYVLDLQARAGEAPLLTVYGGKITTYRRLAEAALRRLAPYFKLGAAVDRGCAAARRRFPA